MNLRERSPVRGPRARGIRPRILAPVVLCMAACSGARAQAVELDVAVHARSLAPGEPVRVVVDAPVPLASLDATFLGEAVSMIRAVRPDGAERERWSGWSMVPLDHPPGPATVRVDGRASDGRAAAGERALEIEAKEFPTEKLSVESRYVTPPPEVRKRLEREHRRLERIYASRTVLPSPAEPFVRPVPGGPTSVFGTRRLYNGKPRSPHPGLDLQARTGTPVAAAGPGEVVLAEELYYSGNTVILDHGNGLFTLYAHLSKIDVQEGQSVEEGHVIGRSGATGRVTGPHLHWGAKIGDRPFDPTALLDEALFR